MSTTSPTRPRVCNHRALEVTAVFLGATVVALVSVLVAVVTGASPMAAISAGVSALVSAFAIGIGAATYLKHGS